MSKSIGLIAAIAIVGLCGNVTPASAQETKLRIIAFGAHPDDDAGAGSPRRRTGTDAREPPDDYTPDPRLEGDRPRRGEEARCDGGDAVPGLRGQSERRPGARRERRARQRRRKTEVREGFKKRFASTAQRFRDKLRELYGSPRGDAVQYAEAFEISEYGRRPTAEEIRRLLPFFGQS